MYINIKQTSQMLLQFEVSVVNSKQCMRAVISPLSACIHMQLALE